MTKRDLREATIARLLKKGGLRAHIDAMCCSCVYDPSNGGTWRQQIDACTVTLCPLHAVRATTSASRARRSLKMANPSDEQGESRGSGGAEENAAPGASEAA